MINNGARRWRKELQLIKRQPVTARGCSSPAAQNWPLPGSFVASFLARLLDGPSASSRAACSSLRQTSLALRAHTTGSSSNPAAPAV